MNVKLGKDILSDTNCLKCMCTNIRSILNKNKRDEIKLRVLDNEVDILGVTESWGSNKIEDEELEIPGFTLFRRDRRGDVTKRGGRILLYIKESLSVVLVKELEV